jgi:hypothetical protein
MLKVHCPGNKCMVVRRRPSIGCKVDMPWVFSEEFGDVFSALLVSHLDIVSNCVQRWDLEVGVSCHEEVDKLRQNFSLPHVFLEESQCSRWTDGGYQDSWQTPTRFLVESWSSW